MAGIPPATEHMAGEDPSLYHLFTSAGAAVCDRSHCPGKRTRYCAGVPAGKQEKANAGSRLFFMDKRFTIAGIALFAYTHVTEKAVELETLPAIRQWIARLHTQPGFIEIG